MSNLKHEVIYVFWETKNGYTELKLNNCSFEEAVDKAVQMGYVAPKWYQFWKPELTVSFIPMVEYFNVDDYCKGTIAYKKSTDYSDKYTSDYNRNRKYSHED